MKGGGYAGFTPTGAVMAAGMNAASKHRAAKVSKGKAAYGQIRFEWIEGIVLRTKKSLIGVMDYYVDVMVPCSQGNERIELWSKSSKGARTVDPELAKMLAELALQRRMQLDPSIRTDCEEQLSRVRRGEGDKNSSLKYGSIGWGLPGNIEHLIGVPRASG